MGLIYEETGTSTKTYHPNFQGSTVALTDDSGNVTDRVEYSPYGSVTYRTGTSDTPFLLHGALGVMTDATGLNYMRARYYNSRIMRFLNADPIGFAGGMNGYAFGGNNPFSNVDPSGFCSQNSGSSFGSTWAASAGDRAIQSSLNEYAMGAVSQATQSENRYWTNPDTGNTEAVSSAFIASNPGDAAVQYFNRMDMAKDVAINAAVFVATDGLGELAFAGEAERGIFSVYQSINRTTDEVQYVGITSNFEARFAAHYTGRNSSGTPMVIEQIQGMTGFSLSDARAVEQTLIDTYGYQRNGGTLLNKINSISPHLILSITSTPYFGDKSF